MAKSSNYFDDSWKEGLVYDLRQVYAIKIIGETLRQIAFARKVGDFPQWFKLLKRDLKIEISKELKEKEMDEVNEKIKKAKEIISKGEAVYLGKSKDNNHYEEIEEILISLEMCLLKLMEDHKMFGAKKEAGRI